MRALALAIALAAAATAPTVARADQPTAIKRFGNFGIVFELR